jgi:hypothetical protein
LALQHAASNNGSGYGVSLPMGTPVREHRGGSLTGDSEGRVTTDMLGDVKIPCKRVSLFIGAPLGNLEGIRLPGLFREKDGTSGFVCWAQGTLGF